MSGVESSHDSDRESFVSRVESCAFTDVGSGAQERAGLQGRAGQGTSGVSPTSTLMRSTVSLQMRVYCIVLFCYY